jgi:hypothetical protein
MKYTAHTRGKNFSKCNEKQEIRPKWMNNRQFQVENPLRRQESRICALRHEDRVSDTRACVFGAKLQL